MEINKIPYFLKNKDWYYLDEEEGEYKLTDEAPQKAIDSYKEFYRLLEPSMRGVKIK